MMELENLIEQIKYNCNVSDSRAWGYFSICGLLMRMRELYRHEHSLKPWQPVGSEALDWVASRESLWEELQDRELGDIHIDERRFSPFDAEGINGLVNGEGFVYGGGYGMFRKPTFFFARLKEKKSIDGHTVYYAGEELVRDISSSPAMQQGANIFIRLEALQALLWDKFLQLKSRKFGGVLGEAFSLCGINNTDEPAVPLFEKIRGISVIVAEIILYHELGEAIEEDDAEEWLDILGTNADKFVELYMRGIKDIIADTSEYGPLRRIVETRNRTWLSFYVALLDGVRKELFPEMRNVFQEFAETGNWALIESARIAGYERNKGTSRDIVNIWRMKGTTEEIKSLISGSVKDGYGKSG
jgi:hypothetical protein